MTVLAKTDAFANVPVPVNEPVLGYAPGSPERTSLAATLEWMSADTADIPVVINGERHVGDELVDVVMPHAHAHVLGRAHLSNKVQVQAAIDGTLAAVEDWRALPFSERAAVFLRAADMLAGPWRDRINAAAMLGQSKTAHQAEIDAACELIDFLRFNVAYAEQLMHTQPDSAPGQWNRSDYRPLEGFVFAVTPFNFLSIAVNLPTAPALMGNAVLWKPATTSLLGSWYALQLLEEAGLPPGVIQFLPGHGPEQGEVALASPHLAGIHFTGSTATFQTLWRGVADNLDRYRAFPRLVGETGGKDFIVAHPSADADAVATAILRGGFEFQGQKCSAASRIYLPRSRWPEIRDLLLGNIGKLTMGDVRDFSNFLGAVIDDRAYSKITGYQDLAKSEANVIAGGGASDAVGYFVEPTLVVVDDPQHRLMREEIFGPVVTIYVYEDGGPTMWEDVLTLIDSTSPYALTGAVFARDRMAVATASTRLRHAAGNFYINDKPTGAVVNQQPFGGGRGSGTNDKAGSVLNLLRWVSPRSIKENLCPPTDWRYPFLGAPED